MSDRAASEKHFHDLLETYRQQILPLVYSNWDELSLSERNSRTKLNNFYCGLHLLVNFAELAGHVVNEYEKCVLDQPIGAESKSETESDNSSQLEYTSGKICCR
jgi:hypothetical protein